MNDIEARNLQERVRALREGIEYSESFQLEAVKLTLTEIIYRLMEQANITKAALAEAIQVSRPYITKMLRGDVNFTIASLVKVASALECHLDVASLFVPKRSAKPVTAWEQLVAASAMPQDAMRTVVAASGEYSSNTEENSYEYPLAA